MVGVTLSHPHSTLSLSQSIHSTHSETRTPQVIAAQIWSSKTVMVGVKHYTLSLTHSRTHSTLSHTFHTLRR
jgi:hypothetical protein